MNYPLISEYIETIKSSEDNFEELSYLRHVLGDDGLPVMTSGNFAVVFKMKDERDGKLYAVKCLTKEQDGRAEASNIWIAMVLCMYLHFLVQQRSFKRLWMGTKIEAE